MRRAGVGGVIDWDDAMQFECENMMMMMRDDGGVRLSSLHHCGRGSMFKKQSP